MQDPRSLPPSPDTRRLTALSYPQSPEQGVSPNSKENGGKLEDGPSRNLSPLMPLSRCLGDYEEAPVPPNLGVLQHLGPAVLSSFPCDLRLGAHPLWSGTAEWPWLQEEAMSSTNLEGCVCWGHVVGQTPNPGFGLQGPWGPGRRQPPLGVWREPGLSPAYMILGNSLPSSDRGARRLDCPTQLAGQGTICSFEDQTAPGWHREEEAQASGWQFRL